MKDVKLISLSASVGLSLLVLWWVSPNLFSRIDADEATVSDYLLLLEVIGIGASAAFFLAKRFARLINDANAVASYKADQFKIQTVLLVINGFLLAGRGVYLLGDRSIESYGHIFAGVLALLYAAYSFLFKRTKENSKQERNA